MSHTCGATFGVPGRVGKPRGGAHESRKGSRRRRRALTRCALAPWQVRGNRWRVGMDRAPDRLCQLVVVVLCVVTRTLAEKRQVVQRGEGLWLRLPR